MILKRKKGTDLFLGDWDGPGLNKSVPFFKPELWCRCLGRQRERGAEQFD